MGETRLQRRMGKKLLHIVLILILGGVCACIEPPSSYVEWDKQRIQRLSDAGVGGETDAGAASDAN